MSKKIKKTIPWFVILTVLILMIGSFNFLTPKTFADLANSSATITNSLPVASSANINASAASITLSENATVTVTVTFTVTDNNGCEDIDSHATNDTIAVLYRTNVTNGAACTPGNADCYSMSCTQTPASCEAGGTDLAATYSCTASVYFWADPTDSGATYEESDWSATATPRDNAGTDGTVSTDTIEMNSLTALNVDNSIVYDALALGANSGTTDETTTVTNTGNRQIDAQVDGYGASDSDGKAMICTIGSFILDYERYKTAASTDWATKTPLTDTAASITDFNLAKSTGTASTKNIYWGLGLPATGVGGTCGGKVVFTAING